MYSLTTDSSHRLIAAAGDANINLSDYLVLKNGKKVSEVYRRPSDMINLVVSNVFVLASFTLFIFVMVAGFKFISGGSKGLQEARTMLGGVFAGFFVMFSAYWVIQIIQYLTGVKILF